MDTMLAALLLLMFIGQAFGGERMSCEVQPVRGDRKVPISPRGGHRAWL